MPEPYTAEYVMARLDEAGATLMALPMRGVFPAGYRSGMPECLQLPQRGEYVHRLDPQRSAEHAERPRWPTPSRKAIGEMDEAYAWVGALPYATDLQIQMRRLVQLRSLTWPLSERRDPHIWSWRRLGALFNVEHATAQDRHARAIDTIVARLNRGLPPPCAATLARIRAFALARQRELAFA